MTLLNDDTNDNSYDDCNNYDDDDDDYDDNDDDDDGGGDDHTPGVKPFLQLSKSVKVGLMGLRGELVRTEEGGYTQLYSRPKKEHVRVKYSE